MKRELAAIFMGLFLVFGVIPSGGLNQMIAEESATPRASLNREKLQGDCI